MLSVLSTIPGDNRTGVYIDSVIKVRFSAEVANVSLAKTIFSLYSVTGISPNEVYSAANVTYSKNPSDPTEVWITPQGDLLANQAYLLLIKGDQNVSDAIIQGVVSTTNQVMNGNYLLHFETTNARAPAPNIAINVTPAVPQPVVNGETTTYSNVDGVGNIVTPEHLEVIATEPPDLFNIQGLDKLRILFNQDIQAIVPSGDILLINSMTIEEDIPVVPLEVQMMEISGNYIDLTFKGYKPNVSGVCEVVAHDPLDPSTWNFPKNHKFRILVNAGSLQVVGRNDVLLENFQIDIDSELFPFLVSVYDTRAYSRGLLTDKISDQTIAYFIRHNSKWIMDRFGLIYNYCTGYFHISPEMLFYIQQYVRCQSIYDGGRTMYTLLGFYRISGKHLGDMSVSYSNPSINTLANTLLDPQTCAKDMVTYITAKMGESAKTPVKSLHAKTHTYPGRWRTEFMRRPIPDPNSFRDRIKTIRYYDGYF